MLFVKQRKKNNYIKTQDNNALSKRQQCPICVKFKLDNRVYCIPFVYLCYFIYDSHENATLLKSLTQN